MMKKIIGFFLLLSVVISSCKKDYVVGQTATPKTSNGWWVVLSVGTTQLTNPGLLSTYNTSFSADSMWVDDLRNGYGFKSKVHLDYKAMTFSVAGSGNIYYDPAHPANFPLTVSITGGKVLPKAGHSRAGNITDSIYMQA